MSGPTFRDPRTKTEHELVWAQPIKSLPFVWSYVDARLRVFVIRSGDLFIEAEVVTDASTTRHRIPGDIRRTETVQRALDALSRALDTDTAAEVKRLRPIAEAAKHLNDVWVRMELAGEVEVHVEASVASRYSLSEAITQFRAALTKEAPDANG